MRGRLIYLMGPSGSGKDSLIDAARDSLLGLDCVVVRRVITRSAESVGEDAMGVTTEQFAQMRREGDFALCWRANGLDYGIPAEIDRWLSDGRHVLINGSRGHLSEAMTRFPTLLPILLTVKTDALRKRLERRGRESAEEIEARLERNALFSTDAAREDSEGIFQLDNSGELSTAVDSLLALLTREGISANADRI
ncbi:phosphonate metabolism protein/1,5-bisphosphokinase (PRPP-forming) PhnN [Pseudomonas frederiksbergensis]|uniref:Ribose 1,5-bisphosphate phosphokinase PhnN n=1 Tax=Pseudomonas frederiksbergensis TaxID=104087 RepID=A0A1J0EU26_9PSED|nr:phosphonate metabolism protein/1,5-bisphosphokinase (PRPP-forming) PhnN [Pseudomonas frederiksbergensis]APC19300.1 phosphonate metabolism protein/1,5-bisphosphokinase (PRPP-forming) PhnN [Pseudomonas frederiksbergensis]